MAKKERRECPREAFVKATLPTGLTKHVVLRSIMKHVIMKVDLANTTVKDIKTLTTDEFAATPNLCMLPFEAEDEALRMGHLLARWLEYERRQLPKGTVLAKDFSNDFPFAGKTTSCTVHLLVDRGQALEAIRFKYKAPEYGYRSRLPSNRPDGSPELLRLQRAGEVEAGKLGIDITKKPVYGAVYYLKHKEDTSKALAIEFEDRLGNNIVSHCFTKNEAAAAEKNYLSIAPDATKTCDPSECPDCLFNDLCHTEFEKRHLMERPPVPIKPINEINLTDAQAQFVSFGKGECRVNAVAGSGKTTVVALRTISLLEEGADPEKILMVTFSEKAKEEMSIRLKSFAHGQIMEGVTLDVDKVQVETFNSWGQHLLDKYYSLLGFSCQPSLVDDVQKKDIIVDLLSAHRSLPLDYRNPFMSTKAAEGAVMKMVRHIDAMKAAHVETEAEVLQVLGPTMTPYAAEMLNIYQEYNNQLLAINAIDYEDQLRLLLQLSAHGIFEKLPYEHIVIDEFQDSNPNQIDIIVELKRRNPGIQSLVVVGDELQAIYGFRNATPDNLVDFSRHFPGMVDIDMTANFRSQKPIIQLANQIIAKTARLGKAIEAHKQSSNVKPAVIEVDNDEKEMDLYVRQIVKLIKDGTPPNTIAVLCRTRAELIKLQMLLDKQNIPTILKVPEIIADAPYVKAIIAFASFLKDHEDLASLALFAKSLGQDPFDEVALKASAEAIIKAFDACTSEAEKVEVFLGFLKDASEDYVGEAFLSKMKACGFKSLAQYLNYCTKYRDYKVKDTQSTSQEATDCVTLITVHSSKGLEWDTVLLSLKRFPVDEESRRLFYVGVTRARERLLLTYTQKQQILADLLK